MFRTLFSVLSFIMIATSLSAAPYYATSTTYANQNHNEAMSAQGVLYYHPKCPHCHVVLDYLNKIHKNLELKNTSDPQNIEELKKFGQSGVPTLVVGGSQVIVGSEQIIDYLKQHPEVLR